MAIKELKTNPAINLKKADKGTNTVIMNKSEKNKRSQSATRQQGSLQAP